MQEFSVNILNYDTPIMNKTILLFSEDFNRFSYISFFLLKV